MLFRSVLWLLNVLVVSELYSLALKEHRGIYSLGRWFLYGASLASLVISGAATASTWGSPLELYDVFLLLERGLRSSLLVFLVLLLGFVHLFPIRWNRNLILHCSVYSVFFLASSLMILYRNWFGEAVSVKANTIVMVVEILCQLA